MYIQSVLCAQDFDLKLFYFFNIFYFQPKVLNALTKRSKKCKMDMKEQGMKRLQRESDDLNHDYQCLYLQKQREFSHYQSILASRTNRQISDSSLPTTEELNHADTIVSYRV